jgi:hypothetical protein
LGWQAFLTSERRVEEEEELEKFMKQTECKLSEFKLLLCIGFSEICVMTIPITVLLSCGRGA